MNQKKIKAIIFDCDGTLVNSETPTAALITNILLENGYQTNFSEILSISQGEKLAILADKLSIKFKDLDVNKFIQTYNHQILDKLKADLVPDQSTIDLIQDLLLPKCVATNGSLERTEIALEACGLLRFFNERIVSGHNINSWKPDPKIIQHSAALLNKDPQECLLVDDSVDGLKAGLLAGAQVAAFRISDQKLGDLKNSVRKIRDLAEILQFI